MSTMKQSLDEKTCVICGKKFRGFGNNAEPVKRGECCDDCNFNKVLPKRLGLVQNGYTED